MSQRINDPEGFYRTLVLITPLMLTLLALHYCKPSLYWDSTQTKFLRDLIGDRAVDALGYVAVLLYYLGMLLIWLTNFSGLRL